MFNCNVQCLQAAALVGVGLNPKPASLMLECRNPCRFSAALLASGRISGLHWAMKEVTELCLGRRD